MSPVTFLKGAGMNYKEQYAPESSGVNETSNANTTNETTTNKITTNDTEEVIIASVDELKQFLLEHADGTTIVSVSLGNDTEYAQGGER